MESNIVRIISILIFVYIIRLIYNHKLKVGHSWFLFIMGVGLLILSIWPGAISILYVISGTKSWLNNIMFFLVLFLFLLVIHCTIVISALTDRVKELGQQIAISFSEIDEKNLNKLIKSMQKINTKIQRDFYKSLHSIEDDSIHKIDKLHDEVEQSTYIATYRNILNDENIVENK
jgi:ABC-type transport system involved in multi-copper enzyme maturation permease subunit